MLLFIYYQAYCVPLNDIHHDFTELEAAYRVRKDTKKQKKLKMSPFKTEAQPQSDKFSVLNLSDKLPPLDLNIELAQKSSSSKKQPVLKQRGIPKAKRRNKVM
jgi:hypothetical protein